MISSPAQECKYISKGFEPIALIHFHWFAAIVGAVLWINRRDLQDEPVLSAKTYTADAARPRLVPTALAALSVNAVTDREGALIILTQS